MLAHEQRQLASRSTTWSASTRTARAPSTASASASSRARSTASSARTAPASRPRSTSSPPCCPRPRARPASPATTSSAEGRAVRDAIGVALQEAALDPFLTGREHMKLQGGLHGLAADRDRAPRRGAARARRARREAADRRVGGYSGGMKRRLDLALALVHEPRLLFLDEPTTGLDIQSRTALWDEVARLAREEGVTVFLTTQYLEEADALADRVGIIDQGKLVAEGTPAAAQGRDRPARPSRPCPSTPPTSGGVEAVLARFGEPLPASRGARRGPPHRGHRGARRRRPRRSTPRASRSPTSSSTRRRLDDVFLAKTGRSLEGAEDDEERELARASETAEPTRWRGADEPPSPHAAPLRPQARYLAWRSVLRTAAPADHDRADARLPAVPARDQRQRARRGDRHPRASRPTPT